MNPRFRRKLGKRSENSRRKKEGKEEIRTIGVEQGALGWIRWGGNLRDWVDPNPIRSLKSIVSLPRSFFFFFFFSLKFG